MKEYKEYEKPKKFSNKKLEALDKAYQIMTDWLRSTNLNIDETLRLGKIIDDIYLEKKLQYFLEEQLKKLTIPKIENIV